MITMKHEDSDDTVKVEVSLDDTMFQYNGISDVLYLFIRFLQALGYDNEAIENHVLTKQTINDIYDGHNRGNND